MQQNLFHGHADQHPVVVVTSDVKENYKVSWLRFGCQKTSFFSKCSKCIIATKALPGCMMCGSPPVTHPLPWVAAPAKKNRKRDVIQMRNYKKNAVLSLTSH